MAEGIYVVIGAVVGVLGSSATTYLNAVLTRKQRPDPIAEARKRLLRGMLADERFAWRRLHVLCHVIGADEETTKGLLLEIGARASEDGEELWSLVDRHPLGGPKVVEKADCTSG